MYQNQKQVQTWIDLNSIESQGQWLITALAGWRSDQPLGKKAALLLPFDLDIHDSIAAQLIRLLRDDLRHEMVRFSSVTDYALLRWTRDMRLSVYRDLAYMAGHLGCSQLAATALYALHPEKILMESQNEVELTMTDLIRSISIHPQFFLNSPLRETVDGLRNRPELWNRDFARPLLRSLLERTPARWLDYFRWLEPDVEEQALFVEVWRAVGWDVIRNQIENDIPFSNSDRWIWEGLFSVANVQQSETGIELTPPLERPLPVRWRPELTREWIHQVLKAVSTLLPRRHTQNMSNSSEDARSLAEKFGRP